MVVTMAMVVPPFELDVGKVLQEVSRDEGKTPLQVDDGYLRRVQTEVASVWWAKPIFQGSKTNVQVLLAELGACSKTRNLERGKQLHAEAVESGHDSDIFIQNTLVNMYAKCGSMGDAQQVFDCLNHPDVVSWNVIIQGYADNGQGHIALDIFLRMRIGGPASDSVTFVAVLKACTSLALKGEDTRWVECRERVKQIHNLAVENGCNSNMYVQSALADVYAKCGSMSDARGVFDSMKNPDVVSWTALILGYAENGEGHTALDLFSMMRNEGIAPNFVTFVGALKACTSLAMKASNRWAECRDKCKALHNCSVEACCSSHSYVQSALVEMYANCSSMVDAREEFDSMKRPDVLSWNILILGYADNGQSHTALDLFSRMKREGPLPDSSTFVAALKACTSQIVKEGTNGWVECRERCKELHNLIMGHACYSHIYVQNALVDMYANCGSMADAHAVFDSINTPNVISWSALILGYAENGQGHSALKLFTKMRIEGPSPNSVTYVAALKACSMVGALEFGKKIHSDIEKRKDELDVRLVTTIVDFYAKCGSLIEAQTVFDSHTKTRDMITWNVLLAGFGSSGDSNRVFELFQRMQDEGFLPDGVTFLSILTSCSHAGLVEKGKKCFDEMPTKYGILPSVEHYNCMIDIYGRANRLDEAMDLLGCMPCRPDYVIWMTILDACRKWKNVEIGELAFQCLISLDDEDEVGYVLMGQIYGSRDMSKEKEMVMGLRKNWKKKGVACWTNEMGEVHRFMDEGCRHPQLDEIREKWVSIVRGMREDEDIEKEDTLCGHSERLALVCALINTQPGNTIRIVKNMSVCGDCHAVTAFISKNECREIICRDANRIHVFKDGNCSCGDFW